MSTSAKNGAMIGGVAAVIRNGVYCANGRLNVTLPLLLTKRNVWVEPKKLMLNGRLTAPDDPSSFRGRAFAAQPAFGSIAFVPPLGAGVTVRFADRAAPPALAPIATVVAVATPFVETTNVPFVWPPAMKSDAGTPATELSALESETVAPPAGAAALRVAVAVELVPP